MNKRHKKTKTPSKIRVLGAKAGYCAYTLQRALPRGWTDQLSHSPGPAPGCPTLCNPMDCSPAGPSVLGDSPNRNTGVGCHALLQGIFPTQGLNPGSPALEANSLPFELPGKPIPTLTPYKEPTNPTSRSEEGKLLLVLAPSCCSKILNKPLLEFLV